MLRPNWSRLRSIRALKEGRVFRLCVTGTHDWVLKRGGSRVDAQVMAAGMGRIGRLCVQTVPVAIARIDEDLLPIWSGAAGREVDCPRPGEAWLLMPYVESVTFRNAREYYRGATGRQRRGLYRAIGRLWVFDILIDNSDRLVKGVNTENVLVSEDLRLYAIDQELGRTLTGELDHDPNRLRRRLEAMRTAERRAALCADLFNEVNRDLLDFQLQDREAFCHAAGAGLVSGVRNVALLTEAEIHACIGPGAISTLRSVLVEFQREAIMMC